MSICTFFHKKFKDSKQVHKQLQTENLKLIKRKESFDLIQGKLKQVIEILDLEDNQEACDGII